MTNTPDKEVHVALALAVRDGHFLMIQRKDVVPMWDKKWEFPGGKVEEGETYEQAVIRELKEETGLDAISQRFLGDHTHDWHLPDNILRVHLHLFHCEMADGTVVCEEQSAHQAQWVSLSDALELDMLEANADILKKYKRNLF